MGKVLFIDPVCPSAYSPHTLKNCGMGGTEATVVRVAEGLAAAEVAVTAVAQHNRTFDTQCQGAYIGVDKRILEPDWAAIVVLRDPIVALNVRRAHKEVVPVFLWLHDLPNSRLIGELEGLAKYGVECVCVSNFQRDLIKDLAISGKVQKLPPLHVVYNPIDDTLEPDPQVPVDPYKLVFFSSPHKGLDYALQTFQLLRNFDKKFTLHVANPGYFRTLGTTADNVVNHGILSHDRALQEVRSAFAVWYPNHVFPETFGLVFAEANAVGTPVITHPHGAAREVLNGQIQLVDCKDKRALVDKLLGWQKDGRPVVKGKPEFRLQAVLQAWERILGVV